MPSITIRFTDKQYKDLKESAKKDKRSMNQYVTIAVEEKNDKGKQNEND